MQAWSVHKVSDISGDERLLIERWLGRSLAGDETISVMTYRPHDAPAAAEREVLRRDIVAQAREIGSRVERVTDEDVDTLVGQAIADLRGRRG